MLRTQGGVERCSRLSGPSFGRAGFTIRVLHEGSESQRGDVSCPGPSCWPGMGQSLSLAQTCLTSEARNNLHPKYYAALPVGAWGQATQSSPAGLAQPSGQCHEVLASLGSWGGQPAGLGGGEWWSVWQSPLRGGLPFSMLTCRQPPQAKAHLSAINI